jgi:hypothetical protein
MIPMPALAQLGGAARTIVVPIFAHVSVRARRSRRKKGCNGYALVQKTVPPQIFTVAEKGLGR